MVFRILFSFYILILPIFGKAIDYRESLLLFGGTIIFLFLYLFSYPPKRQLNKKFIVFEIALIFLSLLSTIFSKNIGYSYYGFFQFIFSLVLLNLSLLYLNHKKISLYIIYFSLFYSLIFLLNKIGLIPIAPQPYLDNFILQVWGHSFLADFLVFPIVILTHFLLSKNHDQKSKFRYYIYLIILVPSLFLSNSRSGIVATTIGIAYLFSAKIPHKFRLSAILSLSLISLFACFQIFYQNPTQKSLDGSRLEFWREATIGFIKSPVLGNGPSNFFYLNKKYQNFLQISANYAHNSLLEYLCLNGLPFTLIFFFSLITSLIFQFRHHHRLNFALGIAAITSSFLEPSWNTLGIFCLSLYYIFRQNPLIISPLPTKSQSKLNRSFHLIILILLSLFFLSKTSSDYLFVTEKPLQSLYADPFNRNAREKLLPQYMNSTLALYKNDHGIYQQLIKEISLPQSENFYLTYLSLNPRENFNEYQKLTHYYLQQQKIDDYITITTNFLNQSISDTPPSQVLNLIYQNAVKQFSINKKQSITLFELLVKHYPKEGHFQIDLANAYWHNDQKDMAFQSLETCLENLLAHDHCQEYINSHQNNQNFSFPGQPDFIEYVNQQFPIN
ncbi:O-antigen ligase family protein [Patescibacteria group bacterium]|nr:O-antigen ligase family protein [Patescibacteria group bacterium]